MKISNYASRLLRKESPTCDCRICRSRYDLYKGAFTLSERILLAILVTLVLPLPFMLL